MKTFPFLLLLLISACASRPAETQNETDSLTQVLDSASIAAPVLENADAVSVAALPDSLKGHPFAAYHGEYRLQSSSSAEQARMTIHFEGNNRFSYSIRYNVADFCSDESSGSFTVDESNTGKDPADRDDSKVITFTLAPGRISVSDGVNEFGVGKCNRSGEFFHCDGPCPEIQSEDYGIEDSEGDTVR